MVPGQSAITITAFITSLVIPGFDRISLKEIFHNNQPAEDGTVYMDHVNNVPMFIISQPSEHFRKYTYDPNSITGPKRWSALSGKQECWGKKQSPVNIDTWLNNIKNGPIRIRYNIEEQPVFGRMLNDGRIAIFRASSKYAQRLLHGVPHAGNDDFVFHEVQFRFGNSSSQGSEHSIDGRHEAAEAQIVHWRKKYKTFHNAVNQPDGIAIIAVLIGIGIGESVNDELELLFTRNMNFIVTPYKYVNAQFNPAAILPNLKRMYTYSGSLTFPPCTENVRWMVMKKKVTVSSSALDKLKSIKDPEDHLVSTYGNLRPTQRHVMKDLESNEGWYFPGAAREV